MQDRFIENLILRTYEGLVRWEQIPPTENQPIDCELVYQCYLVANKVTLYVSNYLPEGPGRFPVPAWASTIVSVNDGELEITLSGELAVALLRPLLKGKLQPSEKLLLDLVKLLD